jgi:hypothetical protein
MGLTEGNETLLGIFDFLARNIGDTTLDVDFEDFDLPPRLEASFDGMCRWAIHEGLITVMSTRNLDDAHTIHSYAKLQNPSITSLGVTVASVAMNRLEGNIILATALVKNPDMLAKSLLGGDQDGSTHQSKRPVEEIRRAS